MPFTLNLKVIGVILLVTGTIISILFGIVRCQNTEIKKVTAEKQVEKHKVEVLTEGSKAVDRNDVNNSKLTSAVLETQKETVVSIKKVEQATIDISNTGTPEDKSFLEMKLSKEVICAANAMLDKQCSSN